MQMTLSFRRLPKSTRKYLRARKAEIRRNIADPEPRAQRIKELYGRVLPQKQRATQRKQKPRAAAEKTKLVKPLKKSR